MPRSVYQMMVNEPKVKHLAVNEISLEGNTDHEVSLDPC